MQPIEGYDLINEAGEIKRLPAGAYVCRVIEAKDVPDKQYLEIYFDIEEGEFKGYFKTLQDSIGKNLGVIRRSYKTSAVPFFKAAIKAFEKSNEGYIWNWKEETLTGKLCAISFQDEEFMQDGVKKVLAHPDEVRSVQALRAGDIKIKPCKVLENVVLAETLNPVPTPINDDDLPF